MPSFDQDFDIFQPHHLTTVIYPSLRHRTQGQIPSECILLPVQNSTERYKPGRLVEDVAVDAQASRVNESECSIHSVSRTTQEGMQRALELFQELAVHNEVFFEFPADAEKFLRHVKVVTQGVGDTRFHVQTKKHPQTKEEMIEVSYITHLFQEDGPRQWQYNFVGEHLMRLKDFLRLDCGELWYQNILDAIYRRTDHAVQHVTFWAAREGIQDIEVEWKERRCPVYENVISKAEADGPKTPQTEDESICRICWVGFDEPSDPGRDNTPVFPRCSRSHAVCRTDFILECRDKGPSEARCPLCRVHWLDESTMKRLANGKDTEGFYYPLAAGNRLYTPYETFERTCADLDEVSAAHSTDTIKVDKTMLLRAWQMMVAGALLEPPASTPCHLQAARLFEFKMVYAEFCAALMEWHGTTHRISIAHSTLRSRVLLRLASRYAASAACFDTAIFWEEFNGKPAPRWEDVPGVRPGVEECVMRMVGRALRFCVVRKCGREGCPQGWHDHGVKGYTFY